MLVTAALATLFQGNALGQYENARFKFSTLYPKNWTQARPPDNGDGQTWTSPDGKSRFWCWGGWNASDLTVQSSYKSQLAELTKAGAKVTYKAQKGDWWVVSGTNLGKANDQFYYRMWIRKSTVKGFRFVYAKSEQKQLDRLIGDVSKSFDPGPDSGF